MADGGDVVIGMHPAGALDVVDHLAAERAALVSLLAGLDDNGWRAPTECPDWSVLGIACHLIGDDMSLLSRQRDGLLDPAFTEDPPATVPDFLRRLNEVNNRFVATTAGLSPTLVIELLQVTGSWTHDWYATVDPERRGESVHWVSPEPAPYWMLAAREFTERWIHQHQIRRAVHMPWFPDPALTVGSMVAASSTKVGRVIDLSGVEKALDLGSHEECLIQLISGGIDSSARPLSIAGPGFASTLERSRQSIAQRDDDTR